MLCDLLKKCQFSKFKKVICKKKAVRFCVRFCAHDFAHVFAHVFARTILRAV